MSLRMRRDPSKYQSSTQQNSLILALKVDVYGMKVDVYGMSLRMRRDPSKYQSSTQQNSLILALKVDVYGMKGGNCLEKKSTIMLE